MPKVTPALACVSILGRSMMNPPDNGRGTGSF